MVRRRYIRWRETRGTLFGGEAAKLQALEAALAS
jgi:hypothetical protein